MFSPTKSTKRAMFSRRTAAGVSGPRMPTPCRAVRASWAWDRGFDPGQRYAVVDTTYPGPQVNRVAPCFDPLGELFA
jgi:hypothetical protein